MENQRFDIAHIRKYVNGELSNKEMFILERASQDDEMLLDIILGMETEKTGINTFNIDEIKHRIGQRTAKKSAKKIRTLRQISIAASLLLITGICYYFLVHETQSLPKNEIVQIDPDSSYLLGQSDLSDTTRISSQIPEELEDNRIASLPEKSKKNTSTPQNRTKKEIKELPRIKINENVPGINNDSTEYQANDDSQQLAQSAPPFQHSPMIEIHTNKASALAANARISARKSHLSDSIDSNIYGYTSEQDSPSRTNDTHPTKLNSVVETSDYQSETSGANVELNEARLDRKNSSKHSVPSVGWSSYQEYLKKAATKYSQEKGAVTVAIKVNNAGEPESIRILETSSPTLSKYAIDIIKQGPKWMKGRRSNNVEVKIEFKN